VLLNYCLLFAFWFPFLLLLLLCYPIGDLLLGAVLILILICLIHLSLWFADHFYWWWLTHFEGKTLINNLLLFFPRTLINRFFVLVLSLSLFYILIVSLDLWLWFISSFWHLLRFSIWYCCCWCFQSHPILSPSSTWFLVVHYIDSYLLIHSWGCSYTKCELWLSSYQSSSHLLFTLFLYITMVSCYSDDSIFLLVSCFLVCDDQVWWWWDDTIILMHV
jgi:hypothetical protein